MVVNGAAERTFLFSHTGTAVWYSYEYHTAVPVHEEVFRQDLYQLFSDKRFVRSAGSLELRGMQGDFVLGRYLAHFVDGAEFDRRAAWGTWPQALRLVNATSFGAEDANPIQSLHNKLLKDSS